MATIHIIFKQLQFCYATISVFSISILKPLKSPKTSRVATNPVAMSNHGLLLLCLWKCGFKAAERPCHTHTKKNNNSNLWQVATRTCNIFLVRQPSAKQKKIRTLLCILHVGEATTTKAAAAAAAATEAATTMQCHAPICVVGDLVSYFQTAAAAATTAAQQAADFDPFKSFEVKRNRDATHADVDRATATSQTLQ